MKNVISSYLVFVSALIGGIQPVFAAETDQLIFSLPEGYGPNDIALAASRNLIIRNDVEVLSEDSAMYPTIGTTGETTVELHSGSSVGTVYSNYRAWLMSNSSVYGDIWSPVKFLDQGSYFLDGEERFDSPGNQIFAWEYGVPDVIWDGVFLDSTQTENVDLPPGRYDTLQLHPQTSVTLRSGSYVFDNFQIDSGAEIVLDDSDGPIFIYVVADNNYWMRGNLAPVNGDYARAILSYAGSQDVFIEQRMVGTLVAPNAKVVVRAATSAHKGAVFAKDIEIDAGTVFKHVPFGWLIDSVTIEPQEVCVGETIDVFVDTYDSWANSESVSVLINGSLGEVRSIRFWGVPGTYKIVVSAYTENGIREQRVHDINVIDCPGVVHPHLTVAWEPRAKETLFSIVNAYEYPDTTTFVWSFGDSSSASSVNPNILHDYSNSRDETKELNSYVASVQILNSGEVIAETDIDVKFINAYALDKKLGLVRPKIQSETIREVDGVFSAQFTIRNIEKLDGIQFETMNFEFVPCDTNQNSYSSEPTSFTEFVGSQDEISDSFNFLSYEIDENICNVIARLYGSTTAGVRVVASSMMDIQFHHRIGYTINDPEILAFLQNALENGWNEEPGQISFNELVDWYSDGHEMPEGIFNWDNYLVEPEFAPTVLARTMMVDENPNGRDCEPGSENIFWLDGDEEKEYECQPELNNENEPIWITDVPPVIANAQKGDALLSRACGFIGKVLQPLGQHYSHIGIMVENFDTVRHSSFSMERLEDYTVGRWGNDGLNETAMKYAFPGSQTETIYDAFFRTKSNPFVTDENGEPVDTGNIPDSNDTYDTVGFEIGAVYCNNQDIIEQKVLKPLPDNEMSIRQSLHDAADASLTENSHYRLYTYTRGNFIKRSEYNAPSSMSDWEDGENSSASSCGVFVWDAMTDAGIFDGFTSEGIFEYSDAQRQLATEVVYNEINNKILGKLKAGINGNENSEIAEDYADQVTNCFAADKCGEDGQDANYWNPPGVGWTVSPHDIYARWPTSMEGGPYGHSEPLLFTSWNMVAKHEWVRIIRYADLNVTVQDTHGTPIPNTTVTIYGTGDNQLTEQDGTTLFEDLAIGSAQVMAVYGPQGLEATEFCEIVETENGEPNECLLTLNGEAKPQAHRITIAGILKVFNSEVGSNDLITYPIIETKTLSDIVEENKTAEILVDECFAGEVRPRLRFNLTLLDDGNDNPNDNEIEIKYWNKLYEGSSCADALDHPQTDPLEGTYTLAPTYMQQVQYWHQGGMGDDFQFDGFIIHDYAWNSSHNEGSFDIDYVYELHDSESGDDDVTEEYTYHETYGISRYDSATSRVFQDCAGGEVRGRTVVVTWKRPKNNDIRSLILAVPYEWTECNYTDPLSDRYFVLTDWIGPGESKTLNTGKLGGADWMEGTMQIRNNM